MQNFLNDRQSVSSDNLNTESSDLPKKEQEFETLGSQHVSSSDNDLLSDDNEIISPSDEAPDGPRVELIREEGIVTKVLVKCTCGKSLEMDCKYSN